jgi:hypothetical protein
MKTINGTGTILYGRAHKRMILKWLIWDVALSR